MIHKFGLAFTHAPNYYLKFGHETPGFVNLFKHELWMAWETVAEKKMWLIVFILFDAKTVAFFLVLSTTLLQAKKS